MKAARERRLDIGSASHTPQTAMNLTEELAVLRRQVRQQEKEIHRLKEEYDNVKIREIQEYLPTAKQIQEQIEIAEEEYKLTLQKKDSYEAPEGIERKQLTYTRGCGKFWM